jgi:hypothetical protein
MAFITQSLIEKGALQLGREEFVRPMSFGNQWLKIRVGLHYTLSVPSGLVGGSRVCYRPASIFIGLCQDTGYTDPSPIEAVSLRLFTTNIAITNNTTYWSCSSNPSTLYHRMGSTQSAYTGGSTLLAGPFSPDLGVIYVDFNFSSRRPGATLSATLRMAASSSAAAHVDRSLFLADMQAEDATSVSLAFNPINIPAYPGNFNLNRVCLHWGRSVPTLHVSEVCVTRFY